MVNLARGETTSYPSEEKADSIGGREPPGEPSEADPDVSRSDSGETEEIASSAGSEQVSLNTASRSIAVEIYSNGLHHSEVAEKYEIPIEAVIWVMKDRGIGFHERDQGEPPKMVLNALSSLSGD